MFLQLGLEALEQGEGIGGAAGEAGQHLVLVQPAHLAGSGLDDDIAEGDLAVAAEGDVRCRGARKGWWCRDIVPWGQL